MCFKVLLVSLAVVLQFGMICGQWIPPTTTAAEMWNPYTWYWPYARAAAQGYAEYFRNAQEITNQLYMQAYATNAFWWTNRPPGGRGGEQKAAQAEGTARQAGPIGTQPVADMSQGGTGWS